MITFNGLKLLLIIYLFQNIITQNKLSLSTTNSRITRITIDGNDLLTASVNANINQNNPSPLTLNANINHDSLILMRLTRIGTNPISVIANAEFINESNKVEVVSTDNTQTICNDFKCNAKQNSIGSLKLSGHWVSDPFDSSNVEVKFRVRSRRRDERVNISAYCENSIYAISIGTQDVTLPKGSSVFIGTITYPVADNDVFLIKAIGDGALLSSDKGYGCTAVFTFEDENFIKRVITTSKKTWKCNENSPSDGKLLNTPKDLLQFQSIWKSDPYGSSVCIYKYNLKEKQEISFTLQAFSSAVIENIEIGSEFSQNINTPTASSMINIKSSTYISNDDKVKIIGYTDSPVASNFIIAKFSFVDEKGRESSIETSSDWICNGYQALERSVNTSSFPKDLSTVKPIFYLIEQAFTTRSHFVCAGLINK